MHVWVDLHLHLVEEEGELVWGDGTHINYSLNIDFSYQGSHIPDEIVYYLAHGTFIAVPRHTEMTLNVVCQANSLQEYD